MGEKRQEQHKLKHIIVLCLFSIHSNLLTIEQFSLLEHTKYRRGKDPTKREEEEEEEKKPSILFLIFHILSTQKMDCNKPPPPLLFFFFFLLLLFFTSFSQATGLDVLGGGTDTACLQKLLPCKDYLKSPSPPSSCCDPLKGIISTDTQCLCKVFNDPESLKSLGITQDDALGLAKTCGANPDVSACKTGS